MAELVLLQPEDCVPLRREVLRPGRPKKESLYPQDDDDRSTHYGVRERGKTLGVISMLHDPRGEIGSEMWRIRGMAVLPDHQRQGHGGMLIRTIQAIATKRGGGLWANVRTGVVDVYAKYGFQKQGEVFKLKGIGPHVVMTWWPKP